MPATRFYEKFRKGEMLLGFLLDTEIQLLVISIIKPDVLTAWAV